MKNFSRKGGCLFSLIKMAVFAVIVLAVAAYFAGSYLASPAVKYAGKVIGVDMELGSVSYSIKEQSIQVNDFVMSNPEGFSQKVKALVLKDAFIDLDLSLGDVLNKKLIEIDEIKVDGFSMSLEYAGGIMGIAKNNSNFNNIINRLKSHTSQQQQAVAENKSANETPYKVAIKKIVFKNGQISGSVGNSNITVKIPDFEMQNVGKSGEGITITEAAIRIFGVLTERAVSTALKDGSNALIQGGSDAGSTTEDAIKKLGKSIFQGL